MTKNNKILVILSSPRRGNSTEAARLFAAGLRGKKTFVDINRLHMNPCTACGKCASSYACVHKDGAVKLIKKISAANTVIVAAPVYFTGVPGPMKIFIDRNQCKWEEFKLKTRNPEPGTRTGVIILTAGHNKAKYFKPAESEVRSLFAVNGIKAGLVLKFGGMDEKGAIKKYAGKIRAAAKKTAKHG